MRSMISSAASSVTFGESSVPMVHELADPEGLNRECDEPKENAQRCPRQLSCQQRSRAGSPSSADPSACRSPLWGTGHHSSHHPPGSVLPKTHTWGTYVIIPCTTAVLLCPLTFYAWMRPSTCQVTGGQTPSPPQTLCHMVTCISQVSSDVCPVMSALYPWLYVPSEC